MLRDWTFQKTFSRLFVYNILFEDAEVDGRYLDLDEKARVFSISAAGCGVASMVRFHPASVDAVDINKHHLALAALKTVAAQRMGSYPEYYDLLGRGWLPRPERTVQEVASTLPTWMQRYWKRHHTRFERSLYNTGLTAKMLHIIRAVSGVDADWLRQVGQLSAEERAAVARSTFEPIMRTPWIQRVAESPLNLLALGVNYEQRDKMLEDTEGDMIEFIVRHLERLARTDVETNWFAWYGIAGQFNHDNKDAVPPYLRRSEHERSLGAPTELRFHHGSIFNVLGNAGANTWSHYTFCDAIDWMPFGVQRNLMDEVVRTARPGAVVLWRSVEPNDIVERHGYQHKLKRLDQRSDAATLEDRSRQYKRVDFYQVQA